MWVWIQFLKFSTRVSPRDTEKGGSHTFQGHISYILELIIVQKSELTIPHKKTRVIAEYWSISF